MGVGLGVSVLHQARDLGCIVERQTCQQISHYRKNIVPETRVEPKVGQSSLHCTVDVCENVLICMCVCLCVCM